MEKEERDGIVRYLDTVLEMRARQREYFRTRTRTSLDESRELERRVDDLTDRLRHRLTGGAAPWTPKQQLLF